MRQRDGHVIGDGGRRKEERRQRHSARALAAALTALLGVATARAAEAPLDARYALNYAGVPVADLALTVEPGGKAIRSAMDVGSNALAGLFGGFDVRMTATSRPGEPPGPQSFRARTEKSDRDRDVRVQWDRRGTVTEAVEMKRGKPRPSEVPQESWSDTVDPLTGMLRLRRWIAAGPAAGRTLEERVFDGRKRFDVEAERLDDAPGEAGTPLHRARVRLLPVWGYERDEDAYMSWPGEPARWFEIVLSGDGRMVPLAVSENGAPLLTLTRDCLKDGGCAARSDGH
ncbi:MAG: DUF3108 domain-containing protein [Geminicoccaceae bacterium]